MSNVELSIAADEDRLLYEVPRGGAFLSRLGLLICVLHTHCERPHSCERDQRHTNT